MAAMELMNGGESQLIDGHRLPWSDLDWECVATTNCPPSVAKMDDRDLTCILCLVYSVLAWHHHDAISSRFRPWQIDPESNNEANWSVTITPDLGADVTCEEHLRNVKHDLATSILAAVDRADRQQHDSDSTTEASEHDVYVRVLRSDKSNGLATPLLRRGTILDLFVGHGDGAIMTLSSPTAMDRGLDSISFARMCRQTLAGISSLGLNKAQKLRDLYLLAPQDEEEISKWNQGVSQVQESTIYQQIDAVCHRQPQAEAICAWDASLSYADLASACTRLSAELTQTGIGRGSIVPVCMHKSAFAVVAVLAVLRAGAAFLLIEASCPPDRFHHLLTTIDAQLLLADKAQVERPDQDRWRPWVVDDRYLCGHSGSAAENSNAVRVDPCDLAYVCFTSGSTGKPKGCCISHRSFCTASHASTDAWDLAPQSRVLQFASFAFDVGIFDILNTLMKGATLCIPNEQARMDDATAVMNHFDVTHAALTSSFSLCLLPADLPSLRVLALGGESLSSRALSHWSGSNVKLINAYGPTECTCTATIELSVPLIMDGSIGKALCGRTWVLDRSDSTRLAPVGALGELLIEGPHVGDGYLHQPALSAQNFLERPKSFDHLAPNESFKTYKTGDLVRYGADGHLIYCGRADAQLKIRGQRVELEEVERCIDTTTVGDQYAIVVGIVCPFDDPSRQHLTMFVEMPDARSLGTDEEASASNNDTSVILDPHVRASVARLGTKTRDLLASQLPTYMIPTCFLAVRRFPRASSGKIARGALIDSACKTLSKSELLDIHPDRDDDDLQQTLPPHATALLPLLSDVLGVALGPAHLGKSFIGLGGDSLRAVKFVSKARTAGYDVAVHNILGSPNLKDAFAHVKDNPLLTKTNEARIEPFTLLPSDRNRGSVVKLTAEQCSVPCEEVKDVFPCTALQENLVLASLRVGDAYWSFIPFRLSEEHSPDHIAQCWQRLCQHFEIFRARFVMLDDHRISHAMLTRSPPFQSLGLDLQEAEQKARDEAAFQLGLPVAKCFTTQDHSLVVQLHHAIFDGRSLASSMHCFDQLLSGSPLSPVSDFRPFVRYCQDAMVDPMVSDWWKRFLSGAPPAFAFGQQSKSSRGTLAIAEYDYELRYPASQEFTLSTIVRAAYALLIGAYSHTTDVVYGVVGDGTAAPLPDITSCYGPSFYTVPFRAQWSENGSLRSLLQAIQESSLSPDVVFHAGLDRIRAIVPEADKASCDLSSLLVVQPEEDESERLSTLQLVPSTLPMKLLHQLNLEIVPKARRAIHFRATFDEHAIAASKVHSICRQLHSIIQHLITADLSTKISSALHASPDEEALILQRNAAAPPLVDRSIPFLVYESVKTNKDRPAVDAWDGTWTYEELWATARQVAISLSEWGLRAGDSVLLILEKSKWVVSTMLGLLLQGIECVPVAADSPRARLEKIAMSRRATRAIISKRFSNSPVPSWMDIRTPQSLASPVQEGTLRPLPTVSPGQIAFTMFSSGTTGEPKGILISNRAFCTSALAHAETLQLTADSRILHFSAYTFDHALFEIFTALIQGACICVPSELERTDDLAGYVIRARVSWAYLTSTVVQTTLHPDTCPSLRVLALGGEPVPQRVLDLWAERVVLICGYGPTECSVCVCGVLRPDRSVRTIGTPSGCRGWVVNPRDPTLLMPLGMVGELIIEGHLLADGYSDGGQVTAEGPWLGPQTWLDRPCTPTSERAPCFRTGDLVQYSDDGSGDLILLGRKDNMVKLWGQRIDVNGVEHVISLSIGMKVAVDVVKSEAQGEADNSSQRLIAFLEFDGLQSSKLFSKAVSGAVAAVQATLPRFMIPSGFLAVPQFPKTISGKLDRRSLRALVQSLPNDALATPELQATPQAPVTATESLLQAYWASTLSIPEAKIGRNSHFFQIGGDSMAAIRLAAAMRRAGQHLTVEQILANPILSQQAAVMSHMPRSASLGAINSPTRFSLLRGIDESGDHRELLDKIAVSLGIDSARIDDAYPTSPMQEGLLALSAKQEGAYLAESIFDLPDTCDAERLLECWTLAAHHLPILRTAFYISQGQPVIQVVLTTSGRPALSEVRLAGRRLVWQIHHALYDPVTRDMVLSTVQNLYRGLAAPECLPFSHFIQFLQTRSKEVSRDYWRDQLQSAHASAFPRHNGSRDKRFANPTNSYFRVIPRIPTITDKPIATLLETALAIVLSRYSEDPDIVFGSVRNGRNIDLPHIEAIAGPTVATVPVIARFNPERLVSEILDDMQQQKTQSIEHEQFGLSRIRESLPDAFKTNVDFRTILVIETNQDASSSTDTNEHPMWEVENLSWSDKAFLTYPLNFLVAIDATNIRLHIQFDQAIIDHDTVIRLAQHFQTAFTEICNIGCQSTLRVLDISLTDAHEVESIIAMTGGASEPIPATPQTIHEIIKSWEVTAGQSCAVSAWDGSLTYSELLEKAGALSSSLAAAQVKPGETVGVYLDRGQLVPVAVISILMAGARFALLDRTLPSARLLSMIQQAEVRLVICAPESQASLIELDSTLHFVAPRLEFQSVTPSPVRLPNATRDGSDQAYVIFTSGSTGTPKGIQISHVSFITAVNNFMPLLGWTSKSHVLHAARYAFDISIFEMLGCLLVGGRLCIPRETDLTAPMELQEFMRQQSITCAVLTPAVIRFLDPRNIPDLRSLGSAGEPVTKELCDLFAPSVRFFNCYGPAECTPLTAVSEIGEFSSFPRRLGRTGACVLWVIEKDNPELLRPLGLSGELLIEGPIVGTGYLARSAVKASRYINAPKWLQKVRGRSTRVFRTGDYVTLGLDGTIDFAGRGDKQVKINGQRLELGEVEHCLQDSLPRFQTVVEVVSTPSGGDVLVAFVCCSSRSERAQIATADLLVPLSTANARYDFSRQIDQARFELARSLPRWAVPQLFVPLERLPTTATLKVDRNALRNLSLETLIRSEHDERKIQVPVSQCEQELHLLWRVVLNLDGASFGCADDFFLLGGDSITAMRLAATAQFQQWGLTTADIFKHSTINDQARFIAQKQPVVGEDATNGTEPPSHDLEEQRRRAHASLLGVDIADIVDVYPCTPLQQGLVVLTERDPEAYWTRFRLNEALSKRDMKRFRNVWSSVQSLLPVLRTRIVFGADMQLEQVVLRDSSPLDESTQRPEDCRGSIVDGRPLVSCHVVETPAGGNIDLRMHHSIFDGWFMELLSELINDIFEGTIPQPIVPFRDFVATISDSSVSTLARDDIWGQYLTGAPNMSWPPLNLDNNPSLKPVTDEHVECSYSMPESSKHRCTTSTILRASWALLLSFYNSSEEVVFGEVLNGRDMSMPGGAMRVAGPTIATVPWRISLGQDQSIGSVLQAVQDNYGKFLPYQHTGLQNITRVLSVEDKHVLDFGSLLLVNSVRGDHSSETVLVPVDENEILRHPYPIRVECRTSPRTLIIDISYDSRILDKRTAELCNRQLAHIVSRIHTSSPETNIKTLRVAPTEDIADIVTWNRKVVPYQNETLHGLVSLQATATPDAAAIDSWDGRLTYRELESWSENVARHLIKCGCQASTVIALMCEKSRVAVVAMLAILKIGAAFLPLDPLQPASRLHNALKQAGVRHIVTSSLHLGKSQDLGLAAVEINESLAATGTDNGETALVTVVESETLACMLFTSGTTGLPKGIMLEHRNLVTALISIGKRICRTSRSRVLQFSSYTFDIAIGDIFMTLIAGGCLCMPSDEERLDELQDCFSRYRITNAHLTPSVANVLEPGKLPTSFETLVLGGELVSARLYSKWLKHHAEVINTYGPTECSVLVCTKHIESVGCIPTDVGLPVACAFWIVSPHDLNILCPIGTVGELIIQGPGVARGYVTPEQNMNTFLNQPPLWAREHSFSTDFRFYRTGDLARYDSTGSLHILGRRDKQIKLNGQRIELEEIEGEILRNLPEIDQVAVDVVPALSSTERPMLCAFVVCVSRNNEMKTPHSSPAALLDRIKTALHARLPAYMVPSHAVILDSLPRSVNGKLDRRRLVSTSIADVRAQQVVTPAESDGGDLSAEVLILRKLWSSVLGVSERSIKPSDHFFAMRGDSISALQLAGAARAQNIPLTVSAIFQHPTLEALALEIQQAAAILNVTPPEPYSLIPDGRLDDILRLAAKQCQIKSSDIEDVYPCSPLQISMFTASQATGGAYWYTRRFRLPDAFDRTKLLAAIDHVTERRPILRTRLIDIEALGTFQVIVRPETSLVRACDKGADGSDAESVQARSLTTYGDPLNRFVLVGTVLIWYAHHATYDAISLRQLDQDIADAYQGRELVNGLPYNAYIGHIQSLSADDSRGFWLGCLDGCNVPSWPGVGPTNQPEMPRRTQEQHQFSLVHGGKDEITTFTYLKAAWAILLGLYSGTTDVMYFTTLSGRDIALRGCESTLGPTIATVPVRVQCSPEHNVRVFLSQIQSDGAKTMANQHVPMSKIATWIRQGREMALSACTLLVMQGRASDMQSPLEKDLGLRPIDTGSHFSLEFPITIHCYTEISGTGLLQMDYDPDVIDKVQAMRCLQQVGSIFQALQSANASASLKDIDLVSETHKELLAAWAEPVVPIQHDAPTALAQIDLHALDRPESPAIDAWDGLLDYKDFKSLSQSLAHRLYHTGVRSGDVVVLCMTKSKWEPTAMYAVWWLGATFTSVYHGDPEARQRAIADRVGARVALTNVDSCRNLCEETIFVGDTTIVTPRSSAEDYRHHSTTSAPAYITFTSGSTGVPKGVVMSHRALAAFLSCCGPGFHLHPTSRMLQFCRPTFDVIIGEICGTLYTGGCLCIPSEEDCMNDLADALVKYRVTSMFLTPTVLKSLPPPATWRLESIRVAGEPFDPQTLSVWENVTDAMYTTYGPAETCVITTCAPLRSPSGLLNVLGRTVLGRTWICSFSNPTSLVPPGCMGEIMLEGPNLADGYWQDPVKTRDAFIEVHSAWPGPPDPRRASTKRLYRSGDVGYFLSDGSLRFCGRRDGQVKISGQRVELEEIDTWLNRSLETCAPSLEGLCVVAKFRDSKAESFAAMLAPKQGQAYQVSDAADMRRVHSQLRESMAKQLPATWIPRDFVHVSRLPVSANGKKDRGHAKEMARDVVLESLRPDERTRTGEGNETPLVGGERNMADIWEAALNGVSATKLSATSNFLTCGGDSIGAMKLVAVARARGFSITVLQILLHPQLSHMTQHLKSVDNVPEDKAPRAFSQVDGTVLEDLRVAIGSQSMRKWKDIEDVYPLTAMQEYYVKASRATPGAGIGQHVYQLPKAVQFEQVQEAIRALVVAHDALRTRFVVHNDALLQVVTKSSDAPTDECHRYVSRRLSDAQSAEADGFKIHHPTHRFAFVEDEDGGANYLIWTVTHAIYDGWSIANVANGLTALLVGHGAVKPPLYKVSQLVQKTLRCRASATSSAFWTDHLRQARPRSLLGTSGLLDRNKGTATSQLDATWQSPARSNDFTISVLLHVSMAMALHRCTGSSRPIIATTLTGRASAETGLSDLIGAAITHIPICIALRDNAGVDIPIGKVLGQTQSFLTSVSPHEHFGFEQIAQLSEHTRAACAHAMELVVHPPSYAGGNRVRLQGEDGDRLDVEMVEHIGSRALALPGGSFAVECTPLHAGAEQSGSGDERIWVRVRYDEGIIATSKVSGFLAAFEAAFQEVREY